MGNGGDLGGKREKRRKERVGPVAANPDNVENSKEAGGGAQGTQGLSKNCTSRDSGSPLSRLIRGFRIIDSPLRGSTRVAQNDWDDRAELRSYVQLINTHTHTHTGTGTGTEARTVAEMGTGTTITGTRIGLGRAEGRQKSARNHKIVVDAVRKTGETWVESETNVEKEGLVQ